MIVTELHGRQIRCQEFEFVTFNAPPPRTCGSYMENYFRHGGLGYLTDNATTTCRFCTYKTGDDFYTPLGLSYHNRWRDLGVYASFIASNLIILFIAVSGLTEITRESQLNVLVPIPELQSSIGSYRIILHRRHSYGLEWSLRRPEVNQYDLGSQK